MKNLPWIVRWAIYLVCGCILIGFIIGGLSLCAGIFFLGSSDETIPSSQSIKPSMPTPEQKPQQPLETIEFNGFTVSLMGYYWEGDNLVTTFSFSNDRSQKNESMMIYAYDQDENRVSAEWPIMSAPTLWPGENKDKPMTWHCGPRSTIITIHLDDLFQGTYTKKSITITQ